MPLMRSEILLPTELTAPTSVAPATPGVFLPDLSRHGEGVLTSLVGPNDDLVIPKNGQKVDWEVELAVVIGLLC
jgi:fumarylacetoacetase-like protein